MIKRLFDVFFSFVLLVLLCWVIILFWILAAIDTRSNGLFFQQRIGQFGKPFLIFKLKSIRDLEDKQYMSCFGSFIRRFKIDELPQLLNVFFGSMSFVGPRPDIEGYYDKLTGDERKILELKPGITSEATLKYVNEEKILRNQNNVKEFNDKVLFPDKVRLNMEYYKTKSLLLDCKILMKTILIVFRSKK